MNTKKTTFTTHASQRVDERLHITTKEIAEILDSGTCTPIGLEHRSKRMHILFYSNDDDECFVAVRDELTKEVVTILPTNFDGHCKVDFRAIEDLKTRCRVPDHPPEQIEPLKKIS